MKCPACGEAYPRLLDVEEEDAVAVARARLAADCPDHDDQFMVWDQYGELGLDPDRWAQPEDSGNR